MKYITVTLNPAVDRSYILPSPINVGSLNRSTGMSEVVYSGKGINVSRELYRLGVDSKMICILRGEEGNEAFRSLVNENLNVFPIYASGRMRQNISILDVNGIDTEINEPGEELEFDSVVKFFSMYEKIISESGSDKVIFISGSTPPGFRKDVYKSLIRNAKEKGFYVVLDADGDLLKKGIEGGPDLIKPNERELENLTGCTLPSETDEKRMAALSAASLIYNRFGCEVLCTLGAKGSVFAGKEGQFICPAIKADIKRFKGAGDMYLARFIYESRINKKSVFDAMKIASEKTSRNLES